MESILWVFYILLIIVRRGDFGEPGCGPPFGYYCSIFYGTENTSPSTEARQTLDILLLVLLQFVVIYCTRLIFTKKSSLKNEIIVVCYGCGIKWRPTWLSVRSSVSNVCGKIVTRFIARSATRRREGLEL